MNLQRSDLVLAGLLIIALAFMVAPVTAAMVTITTSPPMGDAYYLGDTITYSGINTESDTTYLFIRGPNLPLNGGQIQVLDPRHSPVREDNESTFLAIDVGPDNQWSWAWDNHYYSLDPGTYTVYAASAPRDLTHINDTVYNKTTFYLRQPVPTVTIQPSNPVQGDTITISGIAKGSPGPGIAIWIIGPEYSDRFVVNPDPDGFYSLDIDSAEKGMAEGSYHVVVHHPGHWNDLFDIYLDGDWVYDNNTKSNKFRFLGPGRLQGVDAYEALTDAIWYSHDDLIPRDDYDEPLPITFHLQPEMPSAPVASYTGNPTTGDMPLQVRFTDLSTGGPTGWAWFFGDETYTQPWTLVNENAEWAARDGHSMVLIPDGSIILMGGDLKNDTWRSSDNGSTWTLMNESSGWTERNFQSSVVVPDGNILLMGGVELNRGDLPHNDTWRSSDDGATWTLVNESSGWTARYHHCSVALSDGSILVMGGAEDIDQYLNDVWRSGDNGTTWTLVNENAEWSGRIGHRCTVMPDKSIILMGGYDNDNNNLHDVWRSTDSGVTWSRVSESAGWTERGLHSAVAMPDGSLILMGGYDKSNNRLNDVWRSTDNGASWTLMNESAGWSDREGHTSVVMPDGSILLAGGFDKTGISRNDIWRFQPAGSSEQDPTHTYTRPGTYSIALQVYNTAGFNNTRRVEYVAVNSGVKPFPDCSQPPTDPDHDGLYEDLDGDGLITFADVQLYFFKLDWMRIHGPVAAFDFNGNGNLEFDDIVRLNHEIVP